MKSGFSLFLVGKSPFYQYNLRMFFSAPVAYNNLTAAVVLILIITNIKIGHRYLTRSSKYMILMCVSTFFILITDTLSRILIQTDNPFKVPAVFLSSFLFFFATGFPGAAWLLYLDSYINNGKYSLKEKWYYLTTFFLSSIMMFVSIFSELIFYVDDSGNYFRGTGLYIFHIINYLPSVIALGIMVINRKIVSQKLIRIVILFGILPLVSANIQFMYPDAVIVWPVMSICILMTYIFLEVQRIIRDHLTGIYNRQQFEDRINARIEKFSIQGPFTLIIIDLNDFKEINDRFGHDIGDEALKNTAQILSQSVHATDTVARLGGDEFVILLEVADQTNTDTIINRILKNVEKANRSGDSPYVLSLSYGTAVASRSEKCNYKRIFNEADEKMYEYKRNLKKQKDYLIKSNLDQ